MSTTLNQAQIRAIRQFRTQDAWEIQAITRHKAKSFEALEQRGYAQLVGGAYRLTPLGTEYLTRLLDRTGALARAAAAAIATR